MNNIENSSDCLALARGAGEGTCFWLSSKAKDRQRKDDKTAGHQRNYHEFLGKYLTDEFDFLL